VARPEQQLKLDQGLKVLPTIELKSSFSSEQNLGILFMQPEIKLTETPPIRWDRTLVDSEISSYEAQMTSLRYLLSLANDPGLAGIDRTIDFILIPEYGIPLEGVNLILDGLRSSTVRNQILIGGIEGLNKDQFNELLASSSFDLEQKKTMIEWVSLKPDRAWINSAIVIEKHEGQVRYFLQPKLLPSPLGETERQMVEGRWVLLFQTSGEPPIKFLVSMCFDWIGVSAGQDKLSEIASCITESDAPGAVQWIAFVPQCNPKPHKFLAQTRTFLLNKPWKNIHSRNAMVVMINSASSSGKDYGESSIIFSNWSPRNHTLSGFEPRPTYSMQTREGLNNCTEVRFREKRPVIHAVELVLPLATSGGLGEDYYPFRNAIVHTIDGLSRIDKRYPNPPGPVCGYTKVLADFMDLLRTTNLYYTSIEASELGENIEPAKGILQDECVQTLNWDKGLTKRVLKNLCRWKQPTHSENCDTWDEEHEGIALDNLLSVRSTLKLAEINLTEPRNLHGILTVGTQKYSLLVADLGGPQEYRKLLEEIFRQ